MKYILTMMLLALLPQCGSETEYVSILPVEDGLKIIAVIDPCGDAPGVIDEVFIALSDGTLIASFSQNINGDYTRFAVVPDGTFMSTDGSSCVFTKTGRTITWSAPTAGSAHW